jgi:hypothetical protein
MAAEELAPIMQAGAVPLSLLHTADTNGVALADGKR